MYTWVIKVFKGLIDVLTWVINVFKRLINVYMGN